jgi:hypothetical protein
LLKLATDRERRSATSIVEVLVLDYANARGLAVPEYDPGRKSAGE